MSSSLPGHTRRRAGPTGAYQPVHGGYGVGGFGHYETSNGGPMEGTGGQWMTQYLRRVLAPDQMDFESCFEQMVALIGPPRSMAKVYKMANYRKKTKNQWARDDPAFALVQCAFMLVSAIAWGIVCLHSKLSLARLFFLYANEVIGYWLLLGGVIAGACATVANKYLIEHSAHSVAQTVEWLYAFDIHCNGFFVSFLFTHVLQLLLLPILLSDSLVAMLLANLLWASAISSYFFVTHLGYRALPFLKRTEYYLYPILLVLILYAVFLILGVLGYRVNITRLMASFYFGH